VIPLPLRPNSGPSRVLRIPPALHGGKIRLRDRFWGEGSPPPRPPAATSKNKDFLEAVGKAYLGDALLKALPRLEGRMPFLACNQKDREMNPNAIP
jgi:hypothetical protein